MCVFIIHIKEVMKPESVDEGVKYLIPGDKVLIIEEIYL